MHRSLTGEAGLPESVSLRDIATVAGGVIGFRYVCEADLAGVEPNQLPPGRPIPSVVRYVSRLSGDGSRQEIAVSVRPRLFLVPAE